MTTGGTAPDDAPPTAPGENGPGRADDPRDPEGDAPAADEWATLAVAPNAVLAGMAEALLLDSGFDVRVVSDDFVGIGGHPAHPRLLCPVDRLAEAIELLRSHGMV